MHVHISSLAGNSAGKMKIGVRGAAISCVGTQVRIHDPPAGGVQNAQLVVEHEYAALRECPPTKTETRALEDITAQVSVAARASVHRTRESQGGWLTQAAARACRPFCARRAAMIKSVHRRRWPPPAAAVRDAEDRE